MWMGGGRENSLLHNDLEDNLLHMISGYKRVYLLHRDTIGEYINEVYDVNMTETKLSPLDLDFIYDENKHPKGWNVTQYMIDEFPDFYNKIWKLGKVVQVVLQPGDTLFIPALYWHQVSSFCRQIAVNIWFDYYGIKESLGNDFIWHNPTRVIASKIGSLSSRCVDPF